MEDESIIEIWKDSLEETQQEMFSGIFDFLFSDIERYQIWIYSSHKVQEKYANYIGEVLEAAENIQVPYVDIINKTSPKVIASNLGILQKALDQVISNNQPSGYIAMYLAMRGKKELVESHIFSQLCEHMRNMPEVMSLGYNSPIIREEFPISVNDFSDAINLLVADGKDTSEYFRPTAVTFEELREIEEAKKTDENAKKLKIGWIKIKDISGISLEQLDEIGKRYPDVGIRMVDNNLDEEQLKPYKVEEIAKCKEIIEELLSGVIIEPEGTEDREKHIFGQVIMKLARHMKYDHEHTEKSDDIKSRIKQIKEKLKAAEMEEEVKNLNLQLDEIVRQGEKIDFATPRNLIGGLINGKCVCAGYAEIVRNAFACLGIEAKIISGFRKGEDGIGHAWNQIKLDGVWYNMDLTWDRDALVKGKEPRNLLKSGEDFNVHGGHDKYSRNRTLGEEICNDTISDRTVYDYCCFQHKTKFVDKAKNWLRDVASKCRGGKMQEVTMGVINTGARRSQTYDKDERDR